MVARDFLPVVVLVGGRRSLLVAVKVCWCEGLDGSRRKRPLWRGGVLEPHESSREVVKMVELRAERQRRQRNVLAYTQEQNHES